MLLSVVQERAQRLCDDPLFQLCLPLLAPLFWVPGDTPPDLQTRRFSNGSEPT